MSGQRDTIFEIAKNMKIDLDEGQKSISDNLDKLAIDLEQKSKKFSIPFFNKLSDFKGVSGNNGNFQQNFMVYNRSNQMCKKPGCRGLIKKIYISNRSTFYCLKCQK